MPDQDYREIGIYCFGRGIFHKQPRSGLEVGNKKLCLLKDGDLILQITFAWEGAVALCGPKEDGLYGSTRFPTFRVDESRCDPRFLCKYLATPTGREQLIRISPGSAGRNRVLSLKRLPEVEIPLPPLAEQRRIVARIEALAAQIDEAKRLRQEAVEEAEALFGAEAGKRLTDSFPTRRMDELCSLVTDGTHQTPRYVEDGGHTFLSAQNVKPFRFMPEVHRKVSTEDYEACMRRAAPKRGDVLMTRVGAGIGEAAVMNQDLDFAFYVSLALMRPDPDVILPEFLVHWLNSPDGRASSRRETLGKGHSQGNLNLKLLRGFHVPLPSLPEQRRIVAELDPLQAEVDYVKRLQAETAAELDALLPAILDRAFKGEL